MATDPEARATGSSAMMIGIIVLVLVVGIAVAYFSMNRSPDVAVVPDGGDTNTTIVNPPAVDAPDVKVDAPDVKVEVPSGGSSDAGSSGSGTTTEGSSSADGGSPK